VPASLCAIAAEESASAIVARHFEKRREERRDSLGWGSGKERVIGKDQYVMSPGTPGRTTF
jgi:hypothetical protein